LTRRAGRAFGAESSPGARSRSPGQFEHEAGRRRMRPGVLRRGFATMGRVSCKLIPTGRKASGPSVLGRAARRSRKPAYTDKGEGRPAEHASQQHEGTFGVLLFPPCAVATAFDLEIGL